MKTRSKVKFLSNVTYKVYKSIFIYKYLEKGFRYLTDSDCYIMEGIILQSFSYFTKSCENFAVQLKTIFKTL